MQEGDLWGAIAAYDRARDRAGLERVAVVCIRSGKLVEAEEVFKKVHEKIAPELYIRLGEAAFDRGALETAQTACERAGYRQGLVMIAEAMLKKGRFQSAEALFQQAGQPLSSEHLCAFGDDCLNENRPRLELAAEAFERAGSTDGLLQVSDSYERQGMREKALEILKRAKRPGADDTALQLRWDRLTHSLSPIGDEAVMPMLAPDERRCPKCAEIIKSLALKCRHCGLIFDSSLLSNGGIPVAIQMGIEDLAADALKYSIIGIFCFGIILEPMALTRGHRALRLLEQYPEYARASSARSKATAAVIIGWLIVGLWVLLLFMRLGALGTR